MVWVCGVSPFQSETCLFRVPKNLPASEVCSIESRTQPTFESPTPFVWAPCKTRHANFLKSGKKEDDMYLTLWVINRARLL